MNQVESMHVGQTSAHICFCSNCLGFRSTKKSSRKRAVKRRKRKSMDQLRALQIEFEKTTEWSKDLVSYLAHMTGLSEAQVYKWGWDQKKKMQCREKNEDFEECTLRELFEGGEVLCKVVSGERTQLDVSPTCLSCVETILPSSLDSHLYQVQKSYK